MWAVLGFFPSFIKCDRRAPTQPALHRPLFPLLFRNQCSNSREHGDQCTTRSRPRPSPGSHRWGTSAEHSLRLGSLHHRTSEPFETDEYFFLTHLFTHRIYQGTDLLINPYSNRCDSIGCLSNISFFSFCWFILLTTCFFFQCQGTVLLYVWWCHGGGMDNLGSQRLVRRGRNEDTASSVWTQVRESQIERESMRAQRRRERGRERSGERRRRGREHCLWRPQCV